MNLVNIQQFLDMTEEYLRDNHEELSPNELADVTELYDDLSLELSRQQLFDELYN